MSGNIDIDTNVETDWLPLSCWMQLNNLSFDLFFFYFALQQETDTNLDTTLL